MINLQWSGYDYPGYKELSALGWSLHSRSGNGSLFDYVKGPLHCIVKIQVDESLTGQLVYIAFGMITCSTGEFSFPHKQFDRMVEAMTKLISMTLGDKWCRVYERVGELWEETREWGTPSWDCELQPIIVYLNEGGGIRYKAVMAYVGKRYAYLEQSIYEALEGGPP